jgi:hypothetical protein
MLRDLRDLLEEEEEEDFPTASDVRRRNLLLGGGILVGIIVIALLCWGTFSLVINPRTKARQTQIALNETQVAAIGQVSTETVIPNSPTHTQTSIPPTPTNTAIPPTATPTEGRTEEPTSTPTVPLPTSTDTPSPEPTTTPEIIYEENFGAWSPRVTENYEYGISGDGFRILINIPFLEIWLVRQREFTDIRLEVEVARASGPENGYAGLVCRFQDSANYYGMVVDGAGNYRIFKNLGGVSEDLATGQDTALQTGDGVISLRGDCSGDRLILFADGEVLADIQDDAFGEGQVGIIAGTLGLPVYEAFFDNFIIARP